MSDESIDPASPAYKQVLQISDQQREIFAGHPAWKVEFEQLDGSPSPICIWVWLDKQGLMRETYAYAIDLCARPTAE